MLPPSYVFEGMRAVVAGQTVSGAALAIAAVIAIAELFLCAWVFARTHRKALRTGLIARYAAETVCTLARALGPGRH